MAPPSLPGKALGSWLLRICAAYDISLDMPLRHCGMAGRTQETNWVDLPCLEFAGLMRLAQYLRLGRRELFAMHQTPWRIVTHHAEIGYCALCFREDQSAGLPFYWRLAWLDSASTMCVRHRWPLRYVRAASVNANRCNNLAGDGGKQYTAHTLCCRTFALCLRAEPLQRAVSGLLSSDTLTHHYALRDPATIRQVAGDLLDALLAANPLKRQHSTLSHIACLYGHNDWVPLLTVYHDSTNQRIQRLQRFAARAFALSITHVLLYYSVSDRRAFNYLLTSEQTLRNEWLWVLMKDERYRWLCERARDWPPVYVRDCWPELLGAENKLMLHRRKITPIDALDRS